MDANDVLALGLGISPPWQLVGQRLDTDKRPKELHIELAAERGALFPCPDCAIVNIFSIAGIRYLGVPYIAYSATKAAVIQFTKSVALEYADRNVRANVILPGHVDTPMARASLAEAYAGGDVEKMIEVRNAQCPMKRMGDAWDVARAALFLASDEARFITGAELVVDGGLSCRAV